MKRKRAKSHNYIERIRRWFKLHHFKLIRINDTPENIAWGVVIGIVVGITPTFGIGIPLTILFAYLFRVNKFSGIIGLIIVGNPWIASLVWVGSYTIGAVILGSNGNKALKEFKTIGDHEIDIVTLLTNDWSILISKIVQLTKSVGLPYLLGNLILNIVFGVIGYYLTLKIVRAYRELKLKRMHTSARKSS